MCRNKQKAIVLGLALSLFLSGCGVLDTFVTDTGSGESSSVAQKDYLMTDALNQETQTVDQLYTVLTLGKGIFEEVADEQIMEREYINTPILRLDVDGRAVTFGEYVVQLMDYVEVGDVIATVHVEVDELVLEETRLHLQRLQERLQSAEAQTQKELQEILDKKAITYNDYHKNILDIRYRQRQKDWEYTKFDYENQIEETKKELDKLTKVGEVYEVKADRAGFVNIESRHPAGQELWDGAYICHILDNTHVYAEGPRQTDQFCYGMEVALDTRDGIVTAKVVSGGSWALYGNLESSRAVKAQNGTAWDAVYDAYFGNGDLSSSGPRAIFLLEFEEDVSEIKGLNNMMLQGNLKTIENVITIPEKAVTQQNDQYYVTVLKEDGSLLKTEFIPGGSNGDEFWVLDGLTEGMQIVYN